MRCYWHDMTKKRTTWRADHGSRALKQLNEIETSIAALANDDLLDLADIFIGQSDTPLGKIAAAEMLRRDIAL